MTQENRRQAPSTENNADEIKQPLITPELIQQVADKVYALWLQDLRYEQERLYRHDRSARTK